MVKWLYRKKIFWSAITFFVIANLLLGSHIFAKQLEIKAADAEKIKLVLDITQTFANISDLIIHDKDFLTILNTVIGGGKTATDVTYGLLVLSALNEIDLIDSVISQDYKIAAREYFNQVLDERANLKSYWKGIGRDLPKVVFGKITGPVAALTLNSFEITDKTVAIFVEFNVLETMKLYDGLWYYFDTRKQGNESHKVAWEETKFVLGFSVKSTTFLGSGNNRYNKTLQLEQQFSTLYDNWAPYVTPFGISEEYKKQVKEELSDTLVAALETSTVAGEKFKPSLVDKLYNQLEKLKNEVTALIYRINPFKAGITLNLPEEPEELVEDDPQPIQPIEEIEIIAQDIPEEIIEPEIEQLITTTTAPELLASTTEPVPLPEPEPEPPPVPIPKTAPTPGPVFCERDSGNPTRFRVLINEIAWMGTANSTDDEWIELKNIWGIPVNLNGWQLLDKDRQIKIIFSEEDIIPANGYYLLERTDDDSMPDVKADLIYTGALGNTDEALYLFDDQCNIEDEVLANPNWPAGDNLLKKPMARLDVLDWYTGASTPGGENSSPTVIRSSSSAPAPTPTPPYPSASPQVFITEMYIGSESNQKDDFVELYNPNLEAIDLTDYYLQRKTENAQDFSTYVPHELLVGKTIEAQNYFLIANASSTFATSADVVTTYPLTENNTLVLKDPNQEIIDQVFTSNPPAGKSYGRKWLSTTLSYTEEFEAQVPTPRTQNQNSAVEEAEGGEEFLSVVINEIAWAGTEANHFDEWLELFVNSTTSFDGWKILGSKNGTTTLEIPLSGFAFSSTYILIERTDDNTIFDLSAGFFFTGGLDNDGMKLELWDSDGVLVDSIDCSSGWFAGAASPNYVSMERINPLAGSDLANWASNNLVAKNGLDVDGNLINGTPRAENSVAKSSTEVIGGLNITEDFTLTLLGSPYLIEGSITVGVDAKLTIEPGVTIKFKHHSAWKSALNVEGSLEAIGGDDPGQKIIFTSFYDATGTTPAAGDWEWLYFKNSQATLTNVIVKYAGKEEGNPPENPPFTRGAVQIDGGRVAIEKLLIEDSQTLGLWFKDSSDSSIKSSEFKGINTSWSKPAAIYIESGGPPVSGSTFTDNNIGILVENFADPTIERNIFNNNQIPIQINTLLPTISSNTFNNNNYNGVYVVSLSLPEGQTSMVWKEVGIPYIINTLTLVSGLTLQIEPGVVIKFLNNGRLNIEGSFEADGTASNKIVFTSIQDDEFGGDTNNDGAATQPAAGRWHYVYFTPSSPGPVLKNVIIRYGGWYNVFLGGAGAKSGAVKLNGTIATIKNSVFENNLYSGLELTNSDSQIQDTIFEENDAEYAFGGYSAGLILENSTPTFKKTDFNNNYYGVYIEAGDCPDLSKAEFGSEDNANSVDVFPSSCTP